MITLKTPEEIKIMREGGRITGCILRQLLEHAQLGVRTYELDELAGNLIKKAGARASFPMVPRYHWHICATVNQAVVHGIPNDYALKTGDVLGIDLGIFYQGFHTDAAWTIVISERASEINPKIKHFLSTGKQALSRAIEVAKVGNYIGDISYAIQSTVEKAGFSVVRELIGHGVGKKLHEDPPVPGHGSQGIGQKLAEGITIAIEVIYNMGKPKVLIKDDEWTVVTADGSISGLFEHSIAITKAGPIVLTESDSVLTAGSNSDTLWEKT